MFNKVSKQTKKDIKKQQDLAAKLEPLRPLYDKENAENLPKAKEIMDKAQADLEALGFYFSAGIRVHDKTASMAFAEIYIQPVPLEKWAKDKGKDLEELEASLTPQEAAGKAEDAETTKDTKKGSEAGESEAQPASGASK